MVSLWMQCEENAIHNNKFTHPSLDHFHALKYHLKIKCLNIKNIRM
jgi:hypothetical protein